MDSDTKIILAARELAYGVFWRLFSDEPDAALLKAMQSEEFETAMLVISGDALLDEGGLRGAVADIARKSKSGLDDFLEGLRSEYTRDFVGPGKLPAYPWESMNIEGDKSLFQDCTIEVRREYVAHDLRPINYGSVADDHIALELNFLFRLTERCIQLIDDGNRKQARSLLEDERAFVSQHLLNWVPIYVRDFKMKRGGSFYATWLGFLPEMLKEDHRLLDEIIDGVA